MIKLEDVIFFNISDGIEKKACYLLIASFLS